jgi:hypothetical protein
MLSLVCVIILWSASRACDAMSRVGVRSRTPTRQNETTDARVDVGHTRCLRAVLTTERAGSLGHVTAITALW